MLRKAYVESILEKAMNRPPKGGVNMFYGLGLETLSEEEDKYLDELIDKTRIEDYKYPIYEH